MNLPVELIEYVFTFTNDIHLIQHFYKYMSKNTILFLLDKNKKQYQVNDCKHLLELLIKLNISWQPPIRLEFWFCKNTELSIPLIALQYRHSFTLT
jgi:hypothetical protein